MSWVPNKIINNENVLKIMEDSFKSRHFTNYGPAVRKLEAKLAEILSVNSEKCVIVTNNGAHALHALVEGIQLEKGRDLKFTTQDFTFPAGVQGPLKNSYIVDIDDNMELDLS